MSEPEELIQELPQEGTPDNRPVCLKLRDQQVHSHYIGP